VAKQAMLAAADNYEIVAKRAEARQVGVDLPNFPKPGQQAVRSVGTGISELGLHRWNVRTWTPSISAASSSVISPRSCRSSKLEKRIRRTPSCIDAVPIVPSLFRAPQTRHFTSYKQATHHALASARAAHLTFFPSRVVLISRRYCNRRI
jgi:hypothetical protein